MQYSAFLVFALVALSVSGNAAIVGYTSCSASFGSYTATEQGGWSCVAVADNNVGIPAATATASFNGTEVVSSLGSPSSPTSISYTFTSATGGLGFPASAGVEGSDDLLLYSSGPPREGELVFTETTSLAGLGSSLTTSLFVGSLYTMCTEQGNLAPSCTGNFGPANGNGAYTVPITLGVPFEFALAFSDTTNGTTSPRMADGTVSFSFTLLEADGSTPVQVLTPEPASFGLFGLGLFGIIAIGLRRVRVSC